MNSTEKTRSFAKASPCRLLRRASSAVAVLAVTATAIGMPVIAPETTDGASSVVAIARADCPPDCGPGGGGTPTGPPGGGTEFVPPSVPSMPSYDASRGQPPLDQNNGISIYNSAAPQPSQAAQPSQANQNGTYTRAANGEQQPIQHSPEQNTQPSNDWQNLSSQLNQQQNQPTQNDDDNSADNTDTNNNENPEDEKSDNDCASLAANIRDMAQKADQESWEKYTAELSFCLPSGHGTGIGPAHGSESNVEQSPDFLQATKAAAQLRRQEPMSPEECAKKMQEWNSTHPNGPVASCVPVPGTKMSPSESPVWKGFKPFRGKTKTNGESGKGKEYYEWDYTHGNIEVYNKNGIHKGVMDPATGGMIGPAVPGRTIDVS
ncbi:Hypothetical protein ERS075534_00769 [Mycobacteroides abscessus]|nr:Hypothetical protein ERS075534_00769 [Mycobacteroides abscessus]SKQ33502.1 Cytotoxic [Mycobacteroides abscessus subsp. massiliense]SKR21488.1 Cytotoxic [Mycobacteroides abscessus subsp. massiliense]SKR37181.1 Cytotoxic [Mycobacteroides abscessus subsp. massiliense]SKT45605.1 Cytotoxic [Mycobacteroides abscessus subsp. massiliense]